MERVRAQGFFMMRPPLYRDGLEDLINWVNDITPTSDMAIIEIGSYIGESTMQFARRFKQVVSVDPFVDDYDLNDPACHCWPFNMVYEKFLHNTMPYPNIKSIRLTSDEAVGILKQYQFDMLYIDGLHTYDGVIADISNYKSLIKPGGFIAGHDYIENAFGVKKAVDENFKIETTFKDTSWIVRV